jgi:hypothetical protein
VHVFVIQFIMFKASLVDVNLIVTMLDFYSCSTRKVGAVGTMVL